MIKIVISGGGSFRLETERLLLYFKDFPNSVCPINDTLIRYVLSDGGLIGSQVVSAENSLTFDYGLGATISFYGSQREITRLAFWVSLTIEKIKQNYNEGTIPEIICLSEDVAHDLFNPDT